MNKIIVCYQNVDGGQKKMSLALTSLLKEVGSHKIISFYKPYIKGAKPLNYLHSIYLDALFWQRKFSQFNTNDLIICTWYRQALGSLINNYWAKYFIYFHGDEKFDQQLIKNRYKNNFLKYKYAELVSNFIWLLQKIVLQKAELVIVPTQLGANYLIKTYGVSMGKIFLLPNWIDLKQFRPVEPPEKNSYKKHLGHESNDKIVSYIGRIDYKKGIEELIVAFEKCLKTTKFNTYLYIIFPSLDIAQKKYLRDCFDKIYQPTRTKIKLVKKPLNLAQYYQISDCVVLPSSEEIMPLVMQETMACGVPFIGSKAGNIPIFLCKIDEKLILNSTDPSEISQTILKVIGFNQSQLTKIRRTEIILSEQFSVAKATKLVNSIIKRFYN